MCYTFVLLPYFPTSLVIHIPITLYFSLPRYVLCICRKEINIKLVSSMEKTQESKCVFTFSHFPRFELNSSTFQLLYLDFAILKIFLGHYT